MSEEKKEFKTNLTKVNEAYLPMITNQLENNNITLSEYSKSCVANAISAINNVLDTNGVTWSDASLDTNCVTQILLSVAALQLNATANPRECYFQLRNVAVKGADGKSIWKKKIEFGIEGAGNDALLARFGRDVKKVYPRWLVREDDMFEYPKFNGLELTPPQWQPKGTGKVIRVVYPILSTDNTVDYYIAERADVKRNLIAHISNNMMNETFGIITGKNKDGKDRTRYDATEEEKQQIAEKKREILSKAKELDIDAILDSVEFDKYISPAWKEPQSRESMIERKLCNNICKKIPKNFASSFEADIYNENTDEAYKTYKEEYVEVEGQNLEPVALADGSNVDAETGEIKSQPEF